MNRRLRVRKSPIGSFFGGVIGLVIVVVGFTWVIPNAGMFGVLWTMAALVGSLASFYNAFSSRGITNEIIEIEDNDPDITGGSNDVESRLRKLDALNAKGLITPAEYEQRRGEILREI